MQIAQIPDGYSLITLNLQSTASALDLRRWLRGFEFPYFNLSLALLSMPQVVLHLLLQPAFRDATETLR